MKKRIFTFLFATLFLVSGVLMTACNKGGEGSETDIPETVTAKEMFMDAVNSIQFEEIFSADALEAVEAFRIAGSYESTAKDETEKQEIDILVNSNGDMKGTIDSTQYGETVKFDILSVNGESFVSFKEISDEYIKADEDLSDILSGLGSLGMGAEDEENAEENEEIEKVKKAVEKYIDIFQSDKLDSLYDAQIGKEYEIDGTTLSGNVLTFAVTDEDIKELYGEVAEIEGIELNVTVKLVVADEVIIGAHVVAGIGFEDEGVKYSMPFELSYNGSNVKGNLTFTEGEKDIATIDFTNVVTDGKSDMTVTATIVSDYEDEYDSYSYTETSNVEFKYTESEAGKAGEGYLNITAEAEYDEENSELDNTGAFKIPFTFTTEDDGARAIEIKKIEIDMMGVAVGIDVDARLALKKVENGINVNFKFGIDNQMLSADMSGNLTITEAENFKVAAPENYVLAEDIDEEFLNKVEDKYPEFYNEYFAFNNSDDMGYVDVDDNGVYYSFYTEEGVGQIYSAYSVVSSGDGEAVIELANGTLVELTYTEPVLNEEFDWYEFDINNVPYTMEILSEDDFGASCYYIVSDNFSDELSYESEFVCFEYYPEDNDNMLGVGYSFTVDGDEYTLSFPDESEKVMTIVYDAENEEYIIG